MKNTIYCAVLCAILLDASGVAQAEAGAGLPVKPIEPGPLDPVVLVMPHISIDTGIAGMAFGGSNDV